MSYSDDQIADMVARNVAFFAAYQTWSTGQAMQVTGTVDDPASFDANGGKAGPLGYYPVVNVNGQTMYLPCLARLSAIANGNTDAITLALANRLRVDTNAQGLTDQQKGNARANLDALGVFALQTVYADIWPGIDPTGFYDCTAAWATLIAFANGRPIVAEGTYRVKNLFIGDTPVNIRGNGTGTFIHQQGYRVLLARPTLSDPQAVAAVTSVFIGGGNGAAPLAMTKIAASNSHLFARGDVLRLDAADKYPFVTQFRVEQGYNSYSVYLADLLRISGVGQDFTGAANGGFQQGDVITGGSSNATAIVYGVGGASGGTDTLILRSLSGPFTAGENLMVNGSARGQASGAAYLLSAELLTYQSLYQTSMAVRRLGTASFKLDGFSVLADGDVDAIVGAAQRVQAFLFEGLVNPQITNFRAKSAWTRCLRFQGCWAPKVIGFHIDRLPNNANPSESAYGYGVDCCGATAYGLFERITGGNCRHAFTTNSDGDVNGDNYAARAPHTYDGVPKYNIVRNCHIVGNVSEPFDTHPGDLFTTFENCTAEWGDGKGLAVSAAGGFKTRGFGTRHVNCVSVGGTIGFNDYSAMYDAGFQYVQHYVECEARRYTLTGFAVTQAPFNSAQRYTLYERCWVRGWASEASQPYPVGFAAYYGNSRVTMLGCGAAAFAGTPFNVLGGQTWIIEDFTADFSSASTTNSSPPRLDGVPGNFMLNGLTVIRHPTNPSVPQGAIRNTTNSTAYVYLANVRVTLGVVVGMAELPLVFETGGGALVPYRKEDGRYLVNAPAAPAGPSPVGGNWPAGSEVRFPVPVAGGWRGALCTAAGNPGTWKRFSAVEA